MMPLSSLRKVDVASLERSRVLIRLRGAGYTEAVLLPLGTARYIRLRGDLAGVASVIALLDVHAWAGHSMPSLAGIAWHCVDEKLLWNLLVEELTQLTCAEHGLDLTHIEVLELLSTPLVEHTLPCVSMLSGGLFVEALEQEAHPLGANFDFNAVKIELAANLGRSYLAYQTIPTLVLGDVLLIKEIDCQLSCGTHPLFTFELYEEKLMLQDYAEQEESIGVVPVPENQLLDLKKVPVELTFVLFKKMLSMAQLQSIDLGDVIDLPVEAQKNVEIYINNMCFAGGELVQLDDGRLGVEIQRLIRSA
ncbi:FliM/FliN family flagellar motor switch protein [Iodobacter fluviatilis]|uniref:Type III secretion system YscQ/HrcQ family protein n=1 Tax=Iodobacter fluviatilis TaxID=537 RepID=A0A377Q5Q5_9NEIS|nr:FliM/FliN family flagellar motor switch protein [Iodobacter fluviatilis]TCU80248.1 type III secretion system YscQ/HrcQ family protein [Iodobacter fluviatilis]STQ90137.1 type III secretion system protein SpaO [Iodobacter fluviatilis]